MIKHGTLKLKGHAFVIMKINILNLPFHYPKS